MRRLVKWLVRIVLVVVVVVGVWLAAVYVLSEQRMAKTYAIEPAVPRVSTDPGAVERGAHVAAIRGCRDCHGADMSGATIIDDPLFARLSGPNLTPAGPAGKFSDVDLVRAIRHGVGKEGRSLLLMPSQEFSHLSDQDMGDLLAYLHSLPAVDKTPPANRVGPIGRALLVVGKVPLLPAEIVDHEARPEQPVAAPTAAYGSYLSSACTGCHGKGFSGGHIPGTPPSWPDAANLTPHPSGLADWSEDDFRKALREGIARGGRKLQTEFMPVSATRHMSDVEVAALYAFLHSLPAKPHGQH